MFFTGLEMYKISGNLWRCGRKQYSKNCFHLIKSEAEAHKMIIDKDHCKDNDNVSTDKSRRERFRRFMIFSVK